MIYIGIDMGGTNLKGGLVDGQGKLLCKESVPTGDVAVKAEILQRIVGLCRSLEAKMPAGETLAGVGFGIPGIVDDTTGMAVYNPNIPGFHQMPLRNSLKQLYRADISVHMANDADVAALAESAAGAARGTRFSVSVTLGTGVGGGVVVDGKLYTGHAAAGIEIGHMCIARNGEPCNCGRKGCFEAYASATALIRQTQRAIAANPGSGLAASVGGDLSKVDGRTAFAASRQGCPVAAAVVADYIDGLAEGLCNIIVCYQPEVVCIGGGVCNEGAALMNPLQRRVREKLYAPDFQKARIVRAELGNDAGIIGAAMLCR